MTTPMPPHAESLRSKLTQRTATVAVVGLGYVGLPLARALHNGGFQVLGFDLDQTKIEMLTNGQTYLHHLGPDLVPGLSGSDRFRATSDPSQLGQADAVILCVPTPLGKHNEPDMSFIESSTKMVAAT